MNKRSAPEPSPDAIREALALAREVLEPFAKAAQAYLRPDDSVDEMFDIGEAEFIAAHKAFNIIEAALSPEKSLADLGDEADPEARKGWRGPRSGAA